MSSKVSKGAKEILRLIEMGPLKEPETQRQSLGSRNSRGAMYEPEGRSDGGKVRKPPSQQTFQKQRIVQSEIPTNQMDKVETFGFEKNFLEVAGQLSDGEEKEEEEVSPEQRLLRQYEKVDWKRLGDIDFGIGSPSVSQKPVQQPMKKSIDLLFDDISMISPVNHDSTLNQDVSKQFVQPALTPPANMSIPTQSPTQQQNFWAMQEPAFKPLQPPQNAPVEQSIPTQIPKKIINQEIVESDGFLEF